MHGHVSRWQLHFNSRRMDKDAEPPFLDTVEGEVSFFRAVMRTRPVGIHRYFHALSMRNAILRETGKSVSFDEIWRKLESLYNLDALEALESEGYDSPSSGNSNNSIGSPSPSENLSTHPFFHEEFALPGYDDELENLLASRRLRATASVASSPDHAASPVFGTHAVLPPISAGTTSTSAGGIKKRPKVKGTVRMAGLVGGDSDSSALTQESGDETLPPTPRESVLTGTDAGTDQGEDEDVEMAEQNADPAPVVKTVKKQTTKKGGGISVRTRASSSRPAKRRKR